MLADSYDWSVLIKTLIRAEITVQRCAAFHRLVIWRVQKRQSLGAKRKNPGSDPGFCIGFGQD
ncbi:hypothetical protein DS909_05430 [Phaeobacter gallaeciensis]|uniref:Uncharacterized protein n=1 Tax=Phaeobacter gallaeciensis TaxID=60890 RepID=A0A366X4Z7_9RHOB|nr:hypothetical protein DS909_05430 [Phaeobacter gallaeciensis]